MNRYKASKMNRYEVSKVNRYEATIANIFYLSPTQNFVLIILQANF